MYCGLHFPFRESPCILYRITSFSYLKQFKKSAIQEHLKIIIILEQDRPALCYFKHEITWPNFRGAEFQPTPISRRTFPTDIPTQNGHFEH
jgi:hypothetical protein